MALELGRKGKDKITGFAGTIVGRCEYLTGCNQVLLVPPVGKDGAYKDGQWFDEQRVAYEGTGKVRLNNGTTPGADKPAPKY
jgi:hypothetical protein